jgi:hypothetical protein
LPSSQPSLWTIAISSALLQSPLFTVQVLYMCQEKRSLCKSRSQEPKENLYALGASVLIRKKVLRKRKRSCPRPWPKYAE